MFLTVCNLILSPHPLGNLVPRALGKTLVSAAHVPRPKLIARGGCGESIKLQTVKNINFANYYQYKVQNTC